MKRTLKAILLSLVCGAIFTGCGGSGSSGSGSKLKKNQFVGSLPAIYADYAAQKKAHEAKIEEQGQKLIAGGEKNKDKILKLMKEDEEATQAMKEKFQADVKAEIAKVAGKEVPVSYSKALLESEELFYNVAPAKLVDNKGDLAIGFSFSAKRDFEVPRLKGHDYVTYFRLITSEGSTITKSLLLTVKLENTAFSIAAGELLQENMFPLSMSGKSSRYADFAGVEFITKAEYEAK